MSTWMRFILFALLALATSACSTSEATSVPYSPSPGPGAFGQSCSETEDCASLLCVRVDTSGGVCTRSCATNQDCPAAVNWQCLQPPDLTHPICACVRDPSQSCLNGVDNDCNGIVDQCQTCNGASVSVNDPNNCGGCGIVCGSGQQCMSGHCECAAQGTTACGTTCVDTQNDPANCGGCGKTCASGMSCVNGACACSDPSKPNACDTLCTSLATDDNNCGSCGTQCLGGSSCSGGSCKCPATAGTYCGGTCIDTGSDPSNCGACGHACDAMQSCVNASCTCPASAPKLCGSSCVDPSTDRQNCGACSVVCDPTQSCVGGACTCPSSAPSLCSGVCTDTSSDAANCGACGVVCGALQLCQGGMCGCNASGLTICAGMCVNTTSDPANCGACANACSAGEVCSASTCTCTSGVFCGTVCEPVNDSSNCGACGKACGTNQVCSSEACVCGTGFTSCSGSCVNTQTDATNCGACGKTCLATEVCTNGVCGCPQAGQAWCTSAGACTSLNTDPNNCGACGTVCPAAATCSFGTCLCNTSGLTACGTTCVNLQTDTSNCGACGVTCAGREQCAAGVCSCGNPTVGAAMDLGAPTSGYGPPAVGGFGWDGTHLAVAFERVAISISAWGPPSGSVWFSLLNPDGTRAVADQLLRKFGPTGTDAMLPASVAFNGTQWAAFWINETGGSTFNMLVQPFASNGTAIGSQVDITPPVPSGANIPALRVGWSKSAGAYVVVYDWNDRTNNTYGVDVESLGANGTQPGTPVAIAPLYSFMEASVSPAGDIGVIWTDVNTNNRNFSVLDATGTRLQPDVTLTNNFGTHFALTNDGTAWIVAWTTQQPNQTVVHRIASGASDLVIARPSYATAESVGIVWSGSTGAVTWREPNAGGTGDTVFLERFVVGGSSPIAITGPVQLATPAIVSTSSDINETVLMPTGSTSFLAGWTDTNTFPVAPVDVSACP